MMTNYTGDFVINLALLKTKTKLVLKKFKQIKLGKTLPKEGFMGNF